MSEGYECANCGGLSGMHGHYSIDKDAFTCKSRQEWPPCSACGARGLHFCTGRPNDPGPVLEKLLSVIPEPPKGPEPCVQHRKYKAIRRPRTACEACWRLWISKNPE